MRVFDAIAQTVAEFGPTTVFTVLGDGNMMWAAVARDQFGVSFVHSRHEAGAVAMADGWARAHGDVGLATVTQGPGLTNAATALAVARDHGTPLLLIVGETRIVQHADRTGQLYQRCDQAGLVRSLGCRYHAAHDPASVSAVLKEAYDEAQRDGVPVVVGIPGDVLTARTQDPTPTPIARPDLPAADADAVRTAIDLLLGAERPLLVFGRAAIDAPWLPDGVRLAEQVGAGLATTLPARGVFDGHPLDFGVAGGYATPGTRDSVHACDCAVVIGGSLRSHTLDYGALAPTAKVVHVDPRPTRGGAGFEHPDLWVPVDAAEFLRAANQAAARATPSAWVAEEKARHSPDEFSNVRLPAPEETAGRTGVVHPAEAAEALQQSVAQDARIVLGVGHFWWYPLIHLRGRHPSRFLTTYDFGCIGEALPIGIGASLQDRAEPVVIVEGDVSLQMALGELETLVRTEAPALVVVMNDGASSAERHQLQARGWSADEFVSWDPVDFASVMESFGGWAATARSAAEVTKFVIEWQKAPRPALLDVRIDPDVVNPVTAEGLRRVPDWQRRVVGPEA